jgi:hypothetical protein
LVCSAGERAGERGERRRRPCKGPLHQRTAGRLVEVDVDALELQVRVAGVGAGRVDAVLIADDLFWFGLVCEGARRRWTGGVSTSGRASGERGSTAPSRGFETVLVRRPLLLAVPALRVRAPGGPSTARARVGRARGARTTQGHGRGGTERQLSRSSSSSSSRPPPCAPRARPFRPASPPPADDDPLTYLPELGACVLRVG